MTINAHLWLGSPESYQTTLEAKTAVSNDKHFKASHDYAEEAGRLIVNVQDGVAVISLNGSLVNGSAGYEIYYGVTGYEDVRNALASAVADNGVRAILLNVNSGGGEVAGVHELAQLVTRVKAVKPVVTYTGSMMASAALWAAIGSSYSFASETAIVGSIGIIMVHADKTKYLEEMGIKATVIRAGSEKALASPYEELSDKAREGLQNKADTMYGIFMEHVAASRGLAYDVADEKFGQGREFIGKQAVKAGLIDKVGTFEDAFTKVVKLAGAPKASGRATGGAKATNSGNVEAVATTQQPESMDNQATEPQGNSMTKPLTQEQLAAMAAGIVLDEGETGAAPAATSEPETTAPAAVTAEAFAEQVNLLATAKAEVETLKAEAAAATTAHAELKAVADAAVEIARNSVKTMGVHFGIKADILATMSATEVLAEHARVSGLFKEKFKVGGVAATTQEEAPAQKAEVSPMFAAILRSTAK